MRKRSLRKIENIKGSLKSTSGYVRTKFGKLIPDWFTTKVTYSNPFENPNQKQFSLSTPSQSKPRTQREEEEEEL